MKMDLSLILGIIGTIATIVFGFLSIDLFKRKRYPGKITYVKHSLIDLLNNVANNFNEIELLHKNQPINKNLIYIKGVFLNSGDIDLNGKSIEKDLSIELPVGCKWLDVKSTAASKGLTASVVVNSDDDKVASVKFDLFRKNEFVQFEGLIESESKDISSDIIDSDMQFSHRIENTSHVDKKNFLTEKEIKRKKKSAILYFSGAFLFLFLFIATNVFNLFGTKKENVFFEKMNSKTGVFYSIEKSGDTIYLSAKNEGKDETLKISDFNKKYCASDYRLSFWQKFKEYYWMICIQLGFLLIIGLSEIMEIVKARKLMKILNK